MHTQNNLLLTEKNPYELFKGFPNKERKKKEH